MELPEKYKLTSLVTNMGILKYIIERLEDLTNQKREYENSNYRKYCDSRRK